MVALPGFGQKGSLGPESHAAGQIRAKARAIKSEKYVGISA